MQYIEPVYPNHPTIYSTPTHSMIPDNFYSGNAAMYPQPSPPVPKPDVPIQFYHYYNYKNTNSKDPKNESEFNQWLKSKWESFDDKTKKDWIQNDINAFDLRDNYNVSYE